MRQASSYCGTESFCVGGNRLPCRGRRTVCRAGRLPQEEAFGVREKCRAVCPAAMQGKQEDDQKAKKSTTKNSPKGQSPKGRTRKGNATMYKQVSANVSLVEREKEVERFWRENDIFRKTIDSRKEGPVYTFYDGPPTANGKPHIGHVETRTIKDMIPRYRTMKGCMVPRKAGWDTHGLPVELEVEKLLGLDGKEQIEEYGLAPFIDKCKESVWKYKGMWEEFSGSEASGRTWTPLT